MSKRIRRPALTDENREGQLVSLAMDLAEKQMIDGTASSQIVSHFLKAGSTRERIEKDRLRREVELLEAKVESLQSAKRVEELYSEALSAMRTYAGQVVEEDEEEFDDYYDDY